MRVKRGEKAAVAAVGEVEPLRGECAGVSERAGVVAATSSCIVVVRENGGRAADVNHCAGIGTVMVSEVKEGARIPPHWDV